MDPLTVVGVAAGVISAIAGVAALRRKNSTRMPKKQIQTKTRIDEAADIYTHTTGRFERQRDGRWFEYNDKNAVIYTFEEFQRDGKYLYLVDRSRCKDRDPGRPMIMRIPLKVGEAHWSWKNPLKWERFDIVKPQRES